MTSAVALPGITVLERGWLSANNVVLHGGDDRAVVVDTSHVLHAPMTVALLRRALAGQPLAGIVNTHLHSDHCGGNAAVQRAFGCTIAIPPGQWDDVRRWDEDALTYRPTGQRCERFAADAKIAPGQRLDAGGRSWQALAAPGHDPHSIVLFDDRDGVLISADALWENGFGVVFPELDGVDAFDEVAAVLDLIGSLAPRVVIPGHGAPFSDVDGALQRARRRLAGFVADPDRHARHAARVLVKYHLMEEGRQRWSDFVDWFAATELCGVIWRRLDRPDGSIGDFGERLAGELVASGALARDGEMLTDH